MPDRKRISATLAVAAALWLGMLLSPPAARAETSVPLDLQVELLRRVVRFERGLLTRAGAQIRIMIVAGSSQRSQEVAGQLGLALKNVSEIAGRPVILSSYRFTSAAALQKALKEQGIHVAYLAPGLEDELPGIVASLSGLPVITVSTDGDQVDRGVVLGFELVSAHPKLALNLGQARKQGLDFNSELFRLARVVK